MKEVLTSKQKTALLPLLSSLTSKAYETRETATESQSREQLYPAANQLSLFPVNAVATQGAEFRRQLLAFEDAARTQLAPLKFRTVHHFFPGLYAREFHMPENAICTSKIHRHDYLLILVQGRVSMRTELGVETFEALTVLPSFAGVKRALYSHEDCVFITAHPNPNNTRDLAQLEDELIISDLAQWAATPEPTTDWSACPIVDEEEGIEE